MKITALFVTVFGIIAFALFMALREQVPDLRTRAAVAAIAFVVLGCVLKAALWLKSGK